MPIPRYAVIGHPVAHSLSPFIHATFSRQTGIPLEYVAIDAAPEDFDAALAEHAAHGGAGANITLPHKRRAAAICGNLYWISLVLKLRDLLRDDEETVAAA